LGTFDTLASKFENLSTKFDAFVASAAATTSTNGTTRTNQAPRPRITNPAGGREPTAEEAATMSYCWSHGFCPIIAGKDNHIGSNCNAQRVGHKTEATAANKMGGETRICNNLVSPAQPAQQQ
jgi:hypothetical protein